MMILPAAVSEKNRGLRRNTLDSGVDVWQGINVGHGKFGKILRSFVMKKPEKIIFLFFDTKII